MMKKSKKLLLTMALALSCTIAVPCVANADTVGVSNDTQNIEYNESTLELMELFPDFEQLLKTQSTGKLITSDETYLKFTPKTNDQSGYSVSDSENEQLPEQSIDDIKSDYNIEECTEEEYERESALDNLNNRITRAVGNQVSPSCSWFRLDLQVYEGQLGVKYDVYSFGQWLTNPFCTFTDALGIYASEGMMIAPNGERTRRAQYLYKPAGMLNSEGIQLGNNDLLQDSNGKGVLAKFKVRPDCTNHRFMISAGVRYINGSTINEGYIYSEYVHAELGIGGISIGTSGKPSVSAGLKASSHTGYRYVSR